VQQLDSNIQGKPGKQNQLAQRFAVLLTERVRSSWTKVQMALVNQLQKIQWYWYGLR
jgi:hypothetical protein